MENTLQQGNEAASVYIGSGWSKASSEKEVTNYLVIAIVTTVVAVRFNNFLFLFYFFTYVYFHPGYSSTDSDRHAQTNPVGGSAL